MKKRYVKKKEETITSEPTRFCGFVDNEKEKGYLVWCDFDKLKAISIRSSSDRSNTWYENHYYLSVQDFVDKINEDNHITNSHTVEEIYFFDTLKEMHLWLGEN